MAIDDGWMQSAACREVADPDPIFFPPTKQGVKVNAQEAKHVCFQLCSVRVNCLAYAITHRESRGVWGGLTETERRSIPSTTKRKIRELWYELHPSAPKRAIY